MKIVKYLLLFLLAPTIAFAQFSPFGGSGGTAGSHNHAGVYEPVDASILRAATELSSFTGTTIPDDSTIQEALQALETAVEGISAATIDDTKGNGDTTFVWSADKVYDQLLLKAALASPSFTGTVGIGTSSLRVNSSKLQFTNDGSNWIDFPTESITDSAGLAGALSDETGTGAAMFATNPNILHGSSLSAGTGSGQRIPGTSLTAGSAYYQGASGLAAAKADATSTVPAVCIADSTTSCMYSGVYRYSSTQSWTVGGVIYVSAATAGALTQTRPATATNQIQRVGVALAADTILIMPSLDVGTAP